MKLVEAVAVYTPWAHPGGVHRLPTCEVHPIIVLCSRRAYGGWIEVTD